VCRVPETAAASSPRPTVPSFLCVWQDRQSRSHAQGAQFGQFTRRQSYSFTASLELLQALVQASAPEQSSVQLI
jgi:hypothetical protein